MRVSLSALVVVCALDIGGASPALGAAPAPSVRQAPASAPTARVPPRFSVHDTNLDGYIDRQEFEALQARRRIHHAARGRPVRTIPDMLRFEQLDSDGDGRISEREMVSGLRQRHRGGPSDGEPGARVGHGTGRPPGIDRR